MAQQQVSTPEPLLWSQKFFFIFLLLLPSVPERKIIPKKARTSTASVPLYHNFVFPTSNRAHMYRLAKGISSPSVIPHNKCCQWRADPATSIPDHGSPLQHCPPRHCHYHLPQNHSHQMILLPTKFTNTHFMPQSWSICHGVTGTGAWGTDTTQGTFTEHC